MPLSFHGIKINLIRTDFQVNKITVIEISIKGRNHCNAMKNQRTETQVFGYISNRKYFELFFMNTISSPLIGLKPPKCCIILCWVITYSPKVPRHSQPNVYIGSVRRYKPHTSQKLGKQGSRLIRGCSKGALNTILLIFLTYKKKNHTFKQKMARLFNISGKLIRFFFVAKVFQSYLLSRNEIINNLLFRNSKKTEIIRKWVLGLKCDGTCMYGYHTGHVKFEHLNYCHCTLCDQTLTVGLVSIQLSISLSESRFMVIVYALCIGVLRKIQPING